jgi:hypothetical protein
MWVLNMRKSIVKKIVIWASCVILLLAVGGYIAMDYGVKSVLKMVASPESNAEAEKDQEDLIDVLDTMPASEKQDKAKPDPATDGSFEDVDSNPPAPDSQVKASSTQEEKDLEKETGQSTPDKTLEEKETYNAHITAKKIEKAEEEITFSEKTKVTSILLKKLSGSDISLFMKLADGGMTVAEKKEAKGIVLQKLTEKEYDELIEIAANLGLSQGKSYADSIKSENYEIKP